MTLPDALWQRAGAACEYCSVTETDSAGPLSVDGASGSENVFIIDGVEVSDTLNGSLRGVPA